MLSHVCLACRRGLHLRLDKVRRIWIKSEDVLVSVFGLTFFKKIIRCFLGGIRVSSFIMR